MNEKHTPYYQLAEAALLRLRQAGLIPTPKHYSVLYMALSETIPALTAAYQQIIEQKLPLSVERMEYLHATFLADDNREAVQQSALMARKMLAEILSSVQQFSGAAGAAGDAVNAQLNELKDAPTEADLKAIAERIVQSTAAMKHSGDSLHEKLEASQKEISDLRENLAKITVESEHDFLTNVFNRKAFDVRLSERMEEARRDATPLCLLLVDVDHFKQFNDKFGHLIGDEVLKIVARALTDTVKGMDTVARYGGEEFAVILPTTPIGGGMIVAEAIRRTIASRELKRRDTGETYGTVTVSIGVAGLRAEDEGQESIIKRADEALYRSKKAGRNRVTQENLSA